MSMTSKLFRVCQRMAQTVMSPRFTLPASRAGRSAARDEERRDHSWALATVLTTSTLAGADMSYEFHKESPLVPISISCLTTNNISVPPERLLDDLDWELLSQSPACHRGLQVSSEAKLLREQLEQYARRGLMLAPEMATNMVKKFVGYVAMHQIHVTLRASPEARMAIDEGVSKVAGSLADAEKLGDKIADLLLEGRHNEAGEVAQRTIDRLDRLLSLIDELHDRIRDITEEQRAHINKLFLTSGVLVSFIVASEYFQFATGDAVNAALQMAQQVAGAALCVTLSLTAFQWFSSCEAEQYLTDVQKARKSRNLLRHRLESMVDASLLAA